MKIALFGHGKMGSLVSKLAPTRGHLITDLDQADICIDFSHASVVLDHLNLAIAHQIPIVIGTTGWETELQTAQQKVECSSIAALYSPNFSLAMAYFIQLLEHAQTLFPTFECTGVEFHHSQKQDAPSGTAKKIAHKLQLASPFTSVRCGQITGKHSLLFGSAHETISLTHEALNREGFAQGSLEAAEWIQHKKGWYTLDEMLRSIHSSSHPLQI